MDPLLFAQLVLTGAFRSATPVMFTALGQTVSEKTGIANLGAEGCMLMGACIGFIVTAQSSTALGPGGAALAGVVAGAVAGAVFSLLHAYLVINCRANQLASGLVLMFLGLGLTALIGKSYVSKQIEGFNVVPIPFLSDIPFIGPILFRHDILTYLSLLMIPAIWFFLYKTRWGLSLRAVGENRAAAFSTGRNPALIAYGAVCFGGFMAGLGGAQLSLAYTHFWVEGMTQGAGFIAVALVIFGMWHPVRVALGVLLYGGAVSLQLQLQTLGVGISPFFLQMLPYVITLVILMFWARASHRAMPAELGKVFVPQT
jgi:general nucleoside transport system permease protein